MIRPMPNLSHTAYGTWSAGKYMHFGEALDDTAFRASIRAAYDAGIRTFVTADVYGLGRADEALGEALAGVDRSTYALAGIIGHDFYTGTRQGNSGYPRFTAPDLRSPRDYRDYVRMAVEKSLERCRTDRFDLLMLHNPDEIGYTREEVWEALRETRDSGLTDRLGIAPGPANGFTLDIIHCFERYAEAIDWAMIILSPHEPWPGHYVLPSARRHGVEILTRVVDHGGIFWDDVKPGHFFKPGDHRTYRPQGWVEHGCEKLEKMRPIAEKHGLTMLQFAAVWCLSQEPVHSVVPTVIQEAGENARPLADKLRELAAVPVDFKLSPEEIAEVAAIGDNTGCMMLKGASQRHAESLRPDEWPMRPELLALAEKEGVGTEW